MQTIEQPNSPTEPLETVETQNRRQERPKPPRALVSTFKDRRLLTFLVLILIGTNALVPIMLVAMLYRTQLVVVADEAGNIIISPGQDFSESNRLHTMSGITAAKALLDRNPTGFDSAELLRNIYHPDALKMAMQELRDSSAAMQAKNIHQKCEIASVRVQSIRQTTQVQIYYIVVTGQVIRTGSIDGSPTREVDSFRLNLEMWRNPRLSENGRYPLVVKAYKYTRMEPSSPTSKRDDLNANSEEISNEN